MASQRLPKAAPPESRTVRRPKSTLRAADIPGVYKNRAGVLVDEMGVALSFRELRELDTKRMVETIGSAPTTPADILKAVAFDPRKSDSERVDAATKAAPYFSPRMSSIQGGGAGTPPVDVRVLESMTTKELLQYEQLLEKAAQILAKAQEAAS